LLADDHAGMVRVHGLAVKGGMDVRLRSVLRRHEQAILLGDDDPGVLRTREREVDHFGVGGRVEVGEERGVLVAVESVGGGFAAGVDADLELAAGGVGAQVKRDLSAVDRAGQLVVHDVDLAVEAILIGEV